MIFHNPQIDVPRLKSRSAEVETTEMLHPGNIHTVRTGGFTLIELIVVLVMLGVLAAMAVPRLADSGTAARSASVHALAGAIQEEAELIHSLCLTSAPVSGCNSNTDNWFGTINGQSMWISYGWPEAGDELNGRQIDALVAHDGFSAHLISFSTTAFYLDSAPAPASCSVTYVQALNPMFGTPPPGASYVPYSLSMLISGC